MILKGIYTTGWKYSETPPYNYETMEQMKTQVKALQNKYGEAEFNWNIPAGKIISVVLDSLERYFSEGQMGHIRASCPKM